MPDDGQGSEHGDEGKPPDEGTDDNHDEEFDRERALATIHKQRESEAAAKQRASKAEAELARIRQERESENERLIRERDEALAASKTATEALSKRVVRDAVADVAAKLKFKNPRMAYRLIETDGLDAEDPDGVAKIERSLKKVLEDEPYLAGPAAAGGGDGGASDDDTGFSINDQIRQMAGH